LTKEIENKLDLIIGLLGRSLPKQKVSKEQEPVYNLCDGLHTPGELAKMTGKTKGAVAKALERLKKDGLVIVIKNGKRTVYLR